MQSGVPEALNCYARACGQLQFLHRLVDDVEAAASGRFVAPERPADGNRLAGHNPGNRIAVLHGVCVHDPRHDLRRRVDVGSGNVYFRADDDRDFAREAPGEILKFLHRHVLRIADHAALGTAERNVDERALPRHPHGERLDFVERHVGMVANATLAWPARHVVLHAIACEHAMRPRVHPDRHRHLQDAFWLAQVTVDGRIQPDDLRDVIQLALRHLPDVERCLNS